MARIKGRGTGLELDVMRALRCRGLRFQTHAEGLPGRPDVVFRRERVALFIDGDFWHGFRFPRWKDGLSEFWQVKIEGNRFRDRRNFAALRRRGWIVLRLWQHDIKRDLYSAVDRVAGVLLERRASLHGNRGSG